MRYCEVLLIKNNFEAILAFFCRYGHCASVSKSIQKVDKG